MPNSVAAVDFDDRELRALTRGTLLLIDAAEAVGERAATLERVMVKLLDAAHANGVEDLHLDFPDSCQ